MDRNRHLDGATGEDSSINLLSTEEHSSLNTQEGFQRTANRFQRRGTWLNRDTICRAPFIKPTVAAATITLGILLSIFLIRDHQTQTGRMTLKSKSRSWPGFGKVEKIFAFGDSYSTTFWNYDGVVPNASEPMGNPPFPGVTSTNGANWLGYLTGKYNQSMVLTYNFAAGGAAIDYTIQPPYMSPVPDFREQVGKLFAMRYTGSDSRTTWNADTTLFAIWMGVNDLQYNFHEIAARPGEHGLAAQQFAHYHDTLVNLYHLGARNFLILDVPPLSRSPLNAPYPDSQALEKGIYFLAI